MGFRSIVSEVLDLVYPESLYCLCCGKIIDESRVYRLCDTCMNEIKWATGRNCEKCGKPLSDSNTKAICFNCSENEHFFDRGYTTCEYGEHARSIIFSLKYGGRTDISKTVAEVMHDRMNAVRMNEGCDINGEYISSEYDYIIPIPMNKLKEKKRGFNQAADIAKILGFRMDIPCRNRYISRAKNTTPMRELTPAERRENINGAFELTKYAEELIGKKILLIDDLYTTGATVDEAAKLLKGIGAEKVDIFTFASGADVFKGE